MKKEKNTYITPLLTVVEFKTERGYADSAFTWQTPAQQINMFIMTESGMITEQNDGSDGNLAAGYMEGQEDHSNAANGSTWSYSNGSWF
jgi:hypothetical protein